MNVVRFCPRCGSTELKPIVYGEGGFDNRSQCNGCNTISFPLEGDEKFYGKFLGGLKDAKAKR